MDKNRRFGVIEMDLIENINEAITNCDRAVEICDRIEHKCDKILKLNVLKLLES